MLAWGIGTSWCTSNSSPPYWAKNSQLFSLPKTGLQPIQNCHTWLVCSTCSLSSYVEEPCGPWAAFLVLLGYLLWLVARYCTMKIGGLARLVALGEPCLQPRQQPREQKDKQEERERLRKEVKQQKEELRQTTH